MAKPGLHLSCWILQPAYESEHAGQSDWRLRHCLASTRGKKFDSILSSPLLNRCTKSESLMKFYLSSLVIVKGGITVMNSWISHFILCHFIFVKSSIAKLSTRNFMANI